VSLADTLRKVTGEVTRNALLCVDRASGVSWAELAAKVRDQRGALPADRQHGYGQRQLDALWQDP
jgi:hypothetical protein